MRLFIVAAALTLLPMSAWGQAVDPSVGSVDLSVTARVQDSDDRDSPLFPAASGAWTGQLSANRAPSSAAPTQTGASRSNPFPSLVGTSSWVGASSGPSSNGTAIAPSQSSTPADGRNQTLTASHWTKLTGSRKQMMVLTGVELESARSNRPSEENSVERNELSDNDAKLRMLKRAAQKSARLRIANPFQNKADAANVGRWHGTVLSASSLEQQRHKEAQLLLHGYGADDQRRRKRHHHHDHGVAPSPGTR